MEWTGTFEVPRSGVRVGGRLTIESGQSILTTFGSLAGEDGSPILADPWHDEDVETIPMVWGVSEEGSRLTLLELTSLGGNLSWPGEWTTRQQWICECAIGGQIEPVQPVTFSSISFGLSDLSAWLNTPRPEEKRTVKPHRLDLSVTTHEIAEFDDGDRPHDPLRRILRDAIPIRFDHTGLPGSDYRVHVWGADMAGAREQGCYTD